MFFCTCSTVFSAGAICATGDEGAFAAVCWSAGEKKPASAETARLRLVSDNSETQKTSKRSLVKNARVCFMRSFQEAENVTQTVSLRFVRQGKLTACVTKTNNLL